jgi:DNA polymerase-1
MIIVHDIKGIQESVKFLEQCSRIYFDFETTGLDPLINPIIILSIYAIHPEYDNQTFVYDLLSIRDETITALKPLFEHPDILKVAHNAVFDWKFMYHAGVYTSPVECTMIREQVLKSGLYVTGYGLDDIAERRLGIHMDKSVRSGFINRDLSIPLTTAEIEYAGLDAYVLHDIYEQQQREAKDQKLTAVLQLESSIIPITSRMEYYGICIDQDLLREAQPVVQNLVLQAERNLQDEIIRAGLASEIMFDKDGYRAINVGSNPQMLEIFNNLGINVRSMGKKELSDWDAQWARSNNRQVKSVSNASIDGSDHNDDSDIHIGYAHPILRQHAIRTAASKLEGTYITGLINRINPVTGRIHPGFKQCGAVSTGRFSSVAPKQNWAFSS